MDRIPQPDVTDLGDASPSKLRAAGFDMGPGNPNVGAGGSPQAQSFRAQQATGIGPQPAPGMRSAAAPERSAGYSTRAPAFQTGAAAAQRVGDAAKVIGPAIQRAGIRAAEGLASKSNPILNGVAQTAAHGDIYFDSKVPLSDRLRVGAADALGFAGGTIGGLFGAGAGSVVAPGVGTVAGGVAGGAGGLKAGSWLGDKLFDSNAALRRNGYDPERGLSDVVFDGMNGKGMFGGEQAAFNRAITAPGSGPVASAQPSLAAPVAAPTTPAPTTPTATFNDRRFSGEVPSNAPSAPPNVVTTGPGNSFSGDNIREGFTYGGNGRPAGLTPAQGGGGLTGGGTVSTIGNGGIAADMQQLANIRALGNGPDSTVGQGPAGIGFKPGGATNDRTGDINALVRGGMSVRQANAAVQADARLAQEGQIAAMRENTMRQGNSQALQIAAMQDATSRANNAANNSTALRGQDMTNGVARAQAQYQMLKDDRQYQFDREKFSRDLTNDAVTQRGAREKEFAGRVEKMFTGADGKVDAVRAADFQAGIDRSVARLAAEDPRVKSIADLGPAAEQKLVAATTLLQRVRDQGSSWNPMQVDKLKTIDPLDLVDLQVDPKTGDRVITRGKDLKDGGSRGFVIPKRFFETEEANFMWPGTKTNRFDQLTLRGGQ